MNVAFIHKLVNKTATSETQETHPQMLDKNALSQLQGLKDQIEADKEYAEGTIKATRHRFGFVVLDDNREIFLAPDEMQRVLPGDRVSIVIKPVAANDKKAKAQTAGELETLLSTAVDCFVGEVVQKGKAFFIAPDIPELANFTRWLFIPPNARSGAKHGDLVQCQLQRHPFRDGKPAVKVLQNLGSTSTPGIENEYCALRAGIARYLPKPSVNELDKALKTIPENGAERIDFSHLPLVSIDAASTVDIDDAICAQPVENGWHLSIAIADPTALIGHSTSMTSIVAERGTSHYFHGAAIPMLPDSVSKPAALAPAEDRPAIVCQLTIASSGETTAANVELGTVRSRAKLSYQEVDSVINGSIEHDLSNGIRDLHGCFQALRSWREQNELVIEHRTDYRWILDDAKQIGSIEPVEKRTSQILVEECMVAANKAIAVQLQASDKPGPFVAHAGIRRDKSDEAKEFLKRFIPDMAETDFSTIDGFRALINRLNAASGERPLRAMINRLMSRASFSVKPAPHMGMAVPLYTNGTSPLRKALDYCVHLQLKAMLGDTSLTPASATVFDAINQASAKNRQAVSAAQNWLTCNYLNKCAANGEQQFSGSIVHINTSGFTVRLDQNGLEGVIDLRSHKDKFSFDKWEMSLASKDERYALGQQVTVTYLPTDKPRGVQAAFSIAPDSPAAEKMDTTEDSTEGESLGDGANDGHNGSP